MKNIILGIITSLCCLSCQAQSIPVTNQQIQNFYAAGVSYNGSASPSVAGTALYAHAVSSDTTSGGMYAFSVFDAVPNSYKPFTVTSNVGVGIAERIATVGKVAIFIPTSVGISWSGPNTGWQWSGGALVAIPLKHNIYITPTIRFLKSSVSGGSGYQPIPGILFGWGN